MALFLHDFLKSKRAVIFDLYHTLTATELTSPQLLSTSALLGIDRKLWNQQLMEYSRPRLTGKLTDPYLIIKSITDTIKPGIAEEEIRQAAAYRQNRFVESLEKMPQPSIDTIKGLHHQGMKLALLSNADVLETKGWAACPAAPYFDVVVFSCEVGLMKPDKEIYDYCLHQLGEQPVDCVFVGDGGSQEFVGAKAVGLDVIMVTGIVQKLWPEKIPDIQTLADFTITQVSDLLD